MDDLAAKWRGARSLKSPIFGSACSASLLAFGGGRKPTCTKKSSDDGVQRKKAFEVAGNGRRGDARARRNTPSADNLT